MVVYQGSASGLLVNPVTFQSTDCFPSLVTGSNFGQSVGTAGDVNGDGFDDVVAAEPGLQIDTNRSGAICVFHGASAGISTTGRQVISAPISGSPTQSGLDPGCYHFVLTGIDNVGNQVSISTDVTVTAVLTITGAHAGGGTNKVKLGGTGGIYGGATVTVVVCKANSFPCSAGNTAATLTATVASDGSWLTGASGNIGVGPFWAQATQGSRTSLAFGPFAPPYPP